MQRLVVFCEKQKERRGWTRERARWNETKESGYGEGRERRVKMEGGWKVLPTDRDGGGRKKDEGDEKGEAKGRRPASRTKTQVHIQGDVGRCPRVTSIKDGLTPFADDGPGRHYTSTLLIFPRQATIYKRLYNHLVKTDLIDFSIKPRAKRLNKNYE